MNIGLFSVMALTLALPTGAGGGLVLLICSIVYLAGSRHQSGPHLVGRYELLFMGSMILYPLAIALNCLVFVEPILWRYFDNPSRFLMALPIYWAIRKLRIMPDALVIGAIAGASIAGIFAIYQCMILGYERSSGFTNAIPFAHITLLLICTALIPIPLPGIWCWLRICGVVLGVVAMFFSQTVGAWVAAPILFFLMMKWISIHYNINKWWNAAIWVALAGLLFLILEMRGITQAYEEILRQDTIESEQRGQISSVHPASVACRIELWRAGWVFLGEYPWLGVGFDQYQTEVKKLQEKGAISFDVCIRAGYEALKHAHNDFIQISATLGGPAILTYLLPLMFLYYIGHHCCRRHDHKIGIILKVYAVGHGIFSLTQSQLNHNISTTFFAFTAVSLVALAMNRIEIERYSRAENTCIR